MDRRIRILTYLLTLSLVPIGFNACVPAFTTSDSFNLTSMSQANVNQANILTCDVSKSGGQSGFRRLTKREYINTVADLFNNTVDITNFKTEISELTEEAAEGIPVVKLFDTTNAIQPDATLVGAYAKLASVISNTVTNSVPKLQAIGGDKCISENAPADTCIKKFIAGFGKKAHRRPLNNTEETFYFNIYKTGSSPVDRMARVIEVALQSPQFLYLLETEGTIAPGKTDFLNLDGYEIASRLSYSIWGSMPDETLFLAAESGELLTATGISREVERMFSANRAKETIRKFYSQLLQLDQIPNISVTNEVANGIDIPKFKAESSREVVELMDELIWNRGANFSTLMTTDLASPKTTNLANIYEVTQSTGIVSLNDKNRRGLLTRAGLLAMDNAAESNPIRRGVRLRINLLCDTLGSPPADTENLGGHPDLLASTRDQVTVRTQPNSCISCHSQINPLGFAFGEYDGFGRFRRQETVSHNGQTATHNVDARVEPWIESRSEPSIDGAAELQERIATSPKAQFCVARQYARFSLGRAETQSDNCSINALYSALSSEQGSLLKMFKILSQTDAFRTRALPK